MSDHDQSTPSPFVSDVQQPVAPLAAQLDPNTPDANEVDDDAESSQDPRHLRRASLMQQVFASTFHQDDALKQTFDSEHPELHDLFTKLTEIDQVIAAVAPERPLDQINKVDLAILRIIVFEWKTSRTPVKVLIDEGVELAKEYGTDSSPKFVNGVLAKLLT